MKQSEANKIPNPLQKVDDAQYKFTRIQSLIKQICTPSTPQWEQASGALVQVLAHKKWPNNLSAETGQVVEKTVKIKKNKKKKKKKNQLAVSQLQKNITHELCGCCSGKLDNIETNDGYESDDQDYNSQTHIQNLIKNLGLELLEFFYDEIDKSIVRIMKDAQSQQSKTFLKLMKKLAEIFQDYDQQFRQQIERQLEDQAFKPVQIGWTSCDEFKTYIITRFPLLKDFIENFKIADLDEKQYEQFFKLQCRNPLIHSIYQYMEQIVAKKSKKKNKRKLQKLGKQQTRKQSQFILEGGCSNQISDIVQKIKNMKIKQKQREKCYFDKQKFEAFKQKLRFEKKQKIQS